MGKMINIWKLINDQKFIKTMTILDQSFITRTLTRVILTNRFDYLTKLTVHGSHTDKEIHQIGPILDIASNLDELIYTNGNLTEQCLIHMNPMKTLCLINVTIEHNGQLIALFIRSQNTLTTLQYDTVTCCSMLK